MRFSAKRTRCGNTSAALGDAAFDMRRTGASGPAPQELRQPETQRLEHPQRIGAPVGDQSLVSGDAKGAEERHVGLVERLAAEELPAPPLVAPAACSGHHRGVGAQARPSIANLAPISDLQRGVPAGSDDRAAARGGAVDVGLPAPEPAGAGHPMHPICVTSVR
jgi:hypothetical protein